MLIGSVRRFERDERGAVAPTVALALFALIAVGGVGFDYARLAAMDTELQDAADQAALAAATQLDGTAGSTTLAVKAAQALLLNKTYFANDSCGTTIETGVTNSACTAAGASSTVRVTFYSTKADAEAGTNGYVASSTADTTAKFVGVDVIGRKSYYALTPIVAAFNSGTMNANAVAGLGSAICKTPPVMICNPAELTDSAFTVANYVGKGLKLVSVGNGGGAWSPGNFGYLDTGASGTGANALREALGWNAIPGDCLPQSGVNTKPGATVTVTDALNTRFDIFANGQSCPTGGTCGVAADVIKDVMRPGNSSNCAYGNNGQVWQLPTNYYGSGSLPSATATPAALPTTSTPDTMGHPRDICHLVNSGVTGACTGAVGDGVWDRDAYFRTNYKRTAVGVGGAIGTRWSSANWQANTGLSPSVATSASNYASRYNVYEWELANAGTTVDGVVVLGPRIVSGNGAAAPTAYGAPQCGTTPTGASQPDRRRISMAVVNCTANSVNGSSTNVPVIKWIDLFLVEPSLTRERTSQGDVYAEVIGETSAGANGSTASQVVRRSVPYLVR